MKPWLAMLTMLATLPAAGAEGRGFYLDSVTGNDENSGRSPEQAWQSLEKASGMEYTSGDRLLLKKGCVFRGTLALHAAGSEDAPVVVGAYGEGDLPAIDAKGYVAGIAIENCSHLEVENLEVSADGGDPVEPQAGNRRLGVQIAYGEGDYKHIVLRGLYIHDIFAAKADENQSGYGINVERGERGNLADFAILNCRIERTAATGIMIRGGMQGGAALNGVKILDNKLTDIGGPGMNPMSVKNLLVRGNAVLRSGSMADKRMRGRGSGIWPWGSDGVLIEKNVFRGARGINDCCGAHIDFNCKNVIVQYNLSIDNEGGFVEILGNNYNCCYRYNISVNDGARVKGAEWPHPNGTMLKAQLDGKTLFLSSYTGNSPRSGPFNSYIYNNTVYVKEDMHSVFNFTRCADGALIANNIFCILGPTKRASDEEGRNQPPPDAALKNIFIQNNLYMRADTLPPDLPLQDGKPLVDTSPIVADPRFKNPGGFDPADYIPANREAVKDRGIRIEALPGDDVGLFLGLDVKEDFFGNPISGLPDMGAIEIE